MIVTEKEARKIFCPKTFNKNDGIKLYCMGSKCMWWVCSAISARGDSIVEIGCCAVADK